MITVDKSQFIFQDGSIGSAPSEGIVVVPFDYATRDRSRAEDGGCASNWFVDWGGTRAAKRTRSTACAGGNPNLCHHMRAGRSQPGSWRRRLAGSCHRVCRGPDYDFVFTDPTERPRHDHRSGADTYAPTGGIGSAAASPGFGGCRCGCDPSCRAVAHAPLRAIRPQRERIARCTNLRCGCSRRVTADPEPLHGTLRCDQPEDNLEDRGPHDVRQCRRLCCGAGVGSTGWTSAGWVGLRVCIEHSDYRIDGSAGTATASPGSTCCGWSGTLNDCDDCGTGYGPGGD